MNFELIDRIVEFTPGERIVAIKAVSLAEEYLGDHFPSFAVLPGVLMLQALTEAGSWLAQEANGFGLRSVLLRTAKNVVFKNFVRPGNLLTVEVLCRRMSPSESEFEGAGNCDQGEAVKARFGLRHVQSLDGETGPDRTWVHRNRDRFRSLRR